MAMYNMGNMGFHDAKLAWGHWDYVDLSHFASIPPGATVRTSAVMFVKECREKAPPPGILASVASFATGIALHRMYHHQKRSEKVPIPKLVELPKHKACREVQQPRSWILPLVLKCSGAAVLVMAASRKVRKRMWKGARLLDLKESQVSRASSTPEDGASPVPLQDAIDSVAGSVWSRTGGMPPPHFPSESIAPPRTQQLPTCIPWTSEDQVEDAKPPKPEAALPTEQSKAMPKAPLTPVQGKGPAPQGKGKGGKGNEMPPPPPTPKGAGSRYKVSGQTWFEQQQAQGKMCGVATHEEFGPIKTGKLQQANQLLLDTNPSNPSKASLVPFSAPGHEGSTMSTPKPAVEAAAESGKSTTPAQPCQSVQPTHEAGKSQELRRQTSSSSEGHAFSDVSSVSAGAEPKKLKFPVMNFVSVHYQANEANNSPLPSCVPTRPSSPTSNKIHCGLASAYNIGERPNSRSPSQSPRKVEELPSERSGRSLPRASCGGQRPSSQVSQSTTAPPRSKSPRSRSPTRDRAAQMAHTPTWGRGSSGSADSQQEVLSLSLSYSGQSCATSRSASPAPNRAVSPRRDDKSSFSSSSASSAAATPRRHSARSREPSAGSHGGHVGSDFLPDISSDVHAEGEESTSGAHARPRTDDLCEFHVLHDEAGQASGQSGFEQVLWRLGVRRAPEQERQVTE